MHLHSSSIYISSHDIWSVTVSPPFASYVYQVVRQSYETMHGFWRLTCCFPISISLHEKTRFNIMGVCRTRLERENCSAWHDWCVRVGIKRQIWALDGRQRYARQLRVLPEGHLARLTFIRKVRVNCKTTIFRVRFSENHYLLKKIVKNHRSTL